MKAMILAAGLGTRLRPLTNDRPKALVKVAGRTMLEIALTRLRNFGISDVIINVHHFADMVVEFLRTNQNFGMGIEISREDVLLDTGGGLKKAAWFFQDGGDQPFLLHNVDVISDIDFERMILAHSDRGALATLAVQQRKTSRYLLFDEQGLCGRQAGEEGVPELVRTCAHPEPQAFCGVHVISPRLLEMMSEEGIFSIIATYLRLAGSRENILPFHSDEYYWQDLGKPEHIARAEAELRNI